MGCNSNGIPPTPKPHLAGGCGRGPGATPTPTPGARGGGPAGNFAAVLASAAGPATKSGGGGANGVPFQGSGPAQWHNDSWPAAGTGSFTKVVEYEGEADVYPDEHPLFYNYTGATAGATGGGPAGARAPELVTHPAPAVTGASSPAGRAFADVANAQLDRWGGIGVGELVQRWTVVGGKTGERAALQQGVATSTNARIVDISNIVAGWAHAMPSRNDLGRLQLQLDATHQLQATVGLAAQPLRPDAQDVLHSLLEARVTNLERAAAGAVTTTRRTGTPQHEAASSIADQAADLSHIIALANDPALAQRINAAVRSLVGATRL